MMRRRGLPAGYTTEESATGGRVARLRGSYLIGLPAPPELRDLREKTASALGFRLPEEKKKAGGASQRGRGAGRPRLPGRRVGLCVRGAPGRARGGGKAARGRRRGRAGARGRPAAAEGVAARVGVLGDEREGIRVGDGPGLNYFMV